MDRTAKLVLLGIALTVLAVISMAAYPVVFVGTDEGALANSLYQARGINDEEGGRGYESCRKSSGEWRCGPYRLDVDWRGCWEAIARIGVRPVVSGCISLGDVLGFSAPLPDPS